MTRGAPAFYSGILAQEKGKSIALAARASQIINHDTKGENQ